MDLPALDFERPILDLERKIEELKQLRRDHVDFSREIGRLEAKAASLREQTFDRLSPWQVVQLSRHPARPYTLDYVQRLIDPFMQLHGDRLYSDDPAIVGGIGRLGARSVVVIGHQKGRNTKENVKRNFGMPRPEGYRKAMRLMRLAARFSIPVITLIDTPGAYPGIGAEERGQAEAIATNLEVMAGLEVPLIAVVIGEGGSGGALALGVADRLLMLQHSTYSVISPEGCASILWKDGARASDAAAVMRMRAADIVDLEVADEIIPEPPGGAHRDHDAAASNLRSALSRHLDELTKLSPQQLIDARYAKFRRIGAFIER